MRVLSGWILAFLTAVAVDAAIPPLLEEAWTNYIKDIDHWAYTETTRAHDEKGQVRRETVTRYDPSKPYAAQFTILSHTGKTPIEQMQKAARQRGIDRGLKLEKPDGVAHDAQPRVMLNGQPVLADLEHATVFEETAQSIHYLVALHAERGKKSLAENFRTLLQVSKTTRAFERVSIRLPEPRRINVAVKLRTADMLIDFTTVDPLYAPTATLLEDQIEATALFRKRKGGHRMMRSDFKRVKPYRERFDVKIGPSQMIDF